MKINGINCVFANQNFKSGKKSDISTGRRIGIATSSLILPGLGQLINDDTTLKIAGFSIGALLLHAGRRLTSPFVSFAALALHLWSAIDAYRNAK